MLVPVIVITIEQFVGASLILFFDMLYQKFVVVNDHISLQLLKFVESGL